MNNRINVSRTGLNVVGYITAENTMQVRFDNLTGGKTSTYGQLDTTDKFEVSNVADDIITAIASGSSVEHREYAHRTYIDEVHASGFGWPTGTNCFLLS